MAPIRQFAYIFWFSAPIFHLVLAIIMRRKRLDLEFPMFFRYLVFKVCRSVLLFATRELSPGPEYVAYFFLYWLSEVVEIVLSLAVVYELFYNTFGRYEALKKVIPLFFHWATGILILMSTVAVASSPAGDASRLMVGVLSLKQGATIVELGLLLLLFSAANFFQVSWKHYVFGIAMGFALHASVEVIAVTFRVRLGMIAQSGWNFVNGAAYHCAIVIWIVHLLSRARTHDMEIDIPQSNLEEWNTTLRGMMRQ
ncbi:MAG: hypothetical protein AB7O65_00660 [Candidatus Korobacteraceae bacterium]